MSSAAPHRRPQPPHAAYAAGAAAAVAAALYAGWRARCEERERPPPEDHSRPLFETEGGARRIEDVYELLEELGSGVHAVVRLGRKRATGERVAIKCVDKANMRRRQLKREVEILTTVNHPNIISLKDVFEDATTVYLVLELVQGGELFDRIVSDGAFSEQDASKMIRQMTEGLMHLHKHKICHRDLKPENLLLTSKGPDADVKIADFGLSKVLGEKTMMKRSCGTWAYWAPEILRRQPYDYAVDMWSLGVILYIMLSGVHPFDPDGASTDAQIVERILRAEYRFTPDMWSHVSQSAKDVIMRLIHMDPLQRLTCEQLLKHPWVAGTDASDSPMPSAAMASLRDFNRTRRQFRKGLVGIVASQRYIRKANRVTLFPSEIDELRHVFEKFSADDPQQAKAGDEEGDEGGRGMPVTRLATAMRELGEDIRDRDAMRLAMDSDAVDMQGRLGFSSFVAIMAHYVEGRETEEDLHAAFRFLDKQGRGVISFHDIQRALGLMGVRMTERDVEDLVCGPGPPAGSGPAAGPRHGPNGEITFPQFVQLFRESCRK